MKRLLNLAPTLFLAACGGELANDSASDFELDGIQSSAAQGLEGDEVSFHSIRGGRLVELRGPAATELFDILDDAGGFNDFDRDGVRYLVGKRLACVSNGAQALCQLASADLRSNEENFHFVSHGGRFSSASGELFGAIARSQGLEPARVTRVNNGRYICGKDTSNAWCGLLIGEDSQDRTVEFVHRYVGLEDLGPD